MNSQAVHQLIDREDRNIQNTYSAIEASLMLRIAIVQEEKAQLEAKLQKINERLDKLEKIIGI